LASHAAFCFWIWLLIQPSFFSEKRLFAVELHFGIFFIMLLAATDRKPETPCQKGQKKTRNTVSRKLIHAFHHHQNKTHMIHQFLLAMLQNNEGLIYLFLKSNTSPMYRISRRIFPFAGPRKCLQSMYHAESNHGERPRDLVFVPRLIPSTWRLTVLFTTKLP
jgi:hypothetical protein